MGDDRRNDLWVWKELTEAARAMDAVTDSLPPELDVRAVRVLVEIEAIRAEVEASLFPLLGLEPRPASITARAFGYGDTSDEGNPSA